MSLRLELKEFQIALLELKAANMDPDSVHIPGYVRRGQSRLGIGGYREQERRRIIRDREWLLKRLEYLKRQHYIELVKEEEKQFYQLTAKGQYEILRLQFVSHMWAQRSKKWNGNFYLAIFDVPETKRLYRDFFRKLLKRNGFVQLQRSVWMSRYNPYPDIELLLKYLDLEKYFEIMEIHCSKCSKRVAKKVGLWG